MPSSSRATWVVRWNGEPVGVINGIEDESTLYSTPLPSLEETRAQSRDPDGMRVRERLFGDWRSAGTEASADFLRQLADVGEALVDVNGSDYWVFKTPTTFVELQAYRVSWKG